MTTQEIYSHIAPIIANNSEQPPLYSPVRDTGDQGGGFVFVASKDSSVSTSDAPSHPAKAAPRPESAELVQQKAALKRERQDLAQEKQELERQQAIDAEREQLAAERRQVEAQRQQLAMGKRPSVSTGSETGRDGRFIAHNNGTVSDTKTNLMWAAKDNGSDINWANAKSYCENYRGGGYTDWRMPTKDELAGLYDAGKTQLGSDSRWSIHMATELISITGYGYWASEIRGSDAAFFGFDYGERYWTPQLRVGYARALPVRSGK